MTEFSFTILISIIIGIFAGFGAVAIKLAITKISELLFPGSGSVLLRMMNAPWYMLLLVPTVGLILVNLISHYLAPETRGHGIPEVIEAILLKGGIIKPIVALVKSVTSVLTISTGGSVGFEGPIVQIGASIGSSIGQFFRVPSRRMKTLVGCGAAAGIAAAFNVPIAGALFAIEVVLMDYALSQFSPIIISSVIAVVISRTYIGDFPEFKVPAFTWVSNWDVISYFLLGALCGIASYLFMKILNYFEEFFEDKLTFNPLIKAVIGGIAIGGIALLFPNILGTGNDSIDLAIQGNMLWYLAFGLIFVKMVATSITLSSGGSGGVLSPALVIGAMVGVFFGFAVHRIFPEFTAQPGAYALVAMSGLLAGTVRAPLTSILLVFELTGEPSIILPLMVTSTISYVLSSKLTRESVYTQKLLLNNIHLKGAAEINILRLILVKDVYNKDFETIAEDTSFNETVKKIISKNVPLLFVTDTIGRFIGVITLSTIKEVLFEKELLNFVVIAGDIADRSVRRVKLTDNCHDVMEIMSDNSIEMLPVVDESTNFRLLGVVSRKDINEAYQKEIEKIELTTDIATKISNLNKEPDVTFMEGHVITELKPPKSFMGKTIADLKIRNIYGVEILSIKSQTDKGTVIKALPRSDYSINQNDILVVAGESEKVQILKNLS